MQMRDVNNPFANGTIYLDGGPVTFERGVAELSEGEMAALTKMGYELMPDQGPPTKEQVRVWRLEKELALAKEDAAIAEAEAEEEEARPKKRSSRRKKRGDA